MEQSGTWQGLTGEAVEEWFLNHLADSVAGFDQLLAAIVHFQAAGQLDKAETCADLLQDALIKHSAEGQLLFLLEKRAGWQSQPENYAGSCFDILAALFPARSLKQMYLAACGLQNGVPPGEALRRLRILCELTPGKCCYEKTWGLGIVAEIDQFERKFVINFEGKQAHRLAFGYAAEAVRPLDDNHFLALKLRAPEKFKAWISGNPDEAVKETVKQFGEMNLVALRALMTGLMLPEKEWSAFWSGARAKLASDPLVSMPSNRNDPIRLLSGKKTFDERWRHEFAGLSDVERILSETEQLLQHYSRQSNMKSLTPRETTKIIPTPPCGHPSKGGELNMIPSREGQGWVGQCKELPADFKQAVADRLGFILHGMGAGRHDIIVQALLLADRADIVPEGMFDVSVYGKPDLLAPALNAIPARLVGPFLAYLGKKSVLGAEPILQIMPQLPAPVLNEAVAYCRQGDGERKLFDAMRALLQERATGIEMFAWMARNLQLLREKEVCSPDVMAEAAFDLLKAALTAGKRKDVGQLLRQVFKNETLLEEMLSAMSADRRLDFSRRLANLHGLAEVDKRSIAARIIILFPDLAGAFSGPAVAIAAPKLTSHRSYRERQVQLEKLVNEEIPLNSREIGVARGYGDLRENYEYKAAREMQTLLMRRKAEYEKMLAEVKGADFSGIKPEAAGPGASVALKMADGSGKTYHILGEWDSDEKLGIISCRSKLAEALSGHRAGEAVEIPGENLPLNCVIETVRELPPEIRAWINA